MTQPETRQPPLPENPWVSIATPVFNGIEFIEESIESVVAQTYPNVEQVFVDGGSTDGTLDVLKKYSAEHPERIRWFPEENTVQGRGPGNAWNQGLQKARGDILGWLGADDSLEGSDTVQAIVDFFKRDPKVFFVYGGYHLIDENGKRLSTEPAQEFDYDKLLNVWNYISWPASFYRKEVISEVGELDDYGNDFDYLLRIAKLYPLYKLEKIVCNFRKHPESETGSFKKIQRVLKMDYAISRKNGGKLLSRYGKRYFFYTLMDTLHLLPLYARLRKNRKGF